MSSNRAHLHHITVDSQKIPNVNCAQFVLKSASIDKELVFHDYKKKHGSFFAFHGSSLNNWHSILRLGLKNYSNTKFQTNGAVYGPGIYLAEDLGTSFGYAQRGSSGWANSQFGADMKCVALCEIIDEGKNLCTANVHRPRCFHSHSSPYYRVENDSMIVTRYLLVFGSSDTKPGHVAASQLRVPKPLLKSFKGGAVKPK